MTNKSLTQRYLKECVSYDPETGEFRWNKYRPLTHFKNWRGWNQFSHIYGGKEAGNLSHYGYIEIRINFALYKAHRLAWLYMTGEWPEEQIDHINHVRDDNRWCNLRSVTRYENRINSGARKDTKWTVGVTKVKGVWLARITDKGAPINLGYFKSFEEAADVRKRAEAEYGYHPNHGK
ncbi:MAG: HNH endonuclease signature motif containing protein [Pseudomonadota bacterium]